MKDTSTSNEKKRVPMPAMRKTYWFHLLFRCIVFVLCGLLWLLREGEFEILRGMNFFRRFSPLHLLWGVWMADMVYQIVPIKKKIALGSQKLFLKQYKPVQDKINRTNLRKYIVSSNKLALRVLLLWIALGACIGILYFRNILSRKDLFMITAAFFIFDLICVLIWCPFRLLMKTKCCTSCRIFNWDHMMMFTPIAFIPSFYSWSLFLMGLVVLAVWEVSLALYPERFWEVTNAALKCSNCTDKLGVQYCKKLRY